MGLRELLDEGFDGEQSQDTQLNAMRGFVATLLYFYSTGEQ